MHFETYFKHLYSPPYRLLCGPFPTGQAKMPVFGHPDSQHMSGRTQPLIHFCAMQFARFGLDTLLRRLRQEVSGNVPPGGFCILCVNCVVAILKGHGGLSDQVPGGLTWRRLRPRSPPIPHPTAPQSPVPSTKPGHIRFFGAPAKRKKKTLCGPWARVPSTAQVAVSPLGQKKNLMHIRFLFFV